MIGNKSDLKDNREVSTDEAQKFAKTNNMDFYEISAKYDTNVNECFLGITKRIINEYGLVRDIQAYYDDTINFEAIQSQSKCCSCILF